MWNSLKTLINKLGADATSYQDVMKEIKDKTLSVGATNTDLKRIVNYFLYAGGMVAVVMIIISGVQMTTSAGDPGAVKKAKNTLTWAIVGLIIMILAFAIVNFVISALPSSDKKEETSLLLETTNG